MKLEVNIKSTDFWGQSGSGIMKIKNVGTEVVDAWIFDILTENFTITQMWDFTFVTPSISPKEWNKQIPVGGEIESGFSYNGSEDFKASSPTEGVDIIIEVEYKPDPLEKKKVFAYFSEWSIYGREYSVEQIPVDKVTHIVYGFMLPNPSQADVDKSGQKPVPYSPPPTIPEGQLVYHDEHAATINIGKLKTLKQNNPHIKVVISVGGYTLSFSFSKIAADPILRKTFVDSCVKFVMDNGFDGIDIDWEFVGKQGNGTNHVDPVNDGPNFVQMMKEMREAMDIASPDKHLEITAATGCDPEVIANYNGSEPYLDYILLMSYDFVGGWNNYGGHLTGLCHNQDSEINDQFNCHCAVENMKLAGYPSYKICVGCALYGRGWQKIVPYDSEKSKLFGESIEGPAETVSGSYGESGMSSWRDIRDKIADGTYTAYEDPESMAAYCVDANGKTWSYDSPKTAQYKAKYVINKNLGGMLLWELSDDTRDGKDNIVDAIHEKFNVIWSDKWNNPYRKIQSVNGIDPYDELTCFRGGGYMEMENGIMKLSGYQPRFYLNINVQSVEASFDYMRVGTDGESYSGCVCGIRSNSEGHVDFADLPTEETAHTYYFRVRHDGQIDFYRELVHGVTGTILNNGTYKVDSDKWYSYKFRCYNENGMNKLKGYINGVLVLEAEDDDQYMYKSIGKVFIRNTNVAESRYRNFTLKEISGADPEPEPVEPEQPVEPIEPEQPVEPIEPEQPIEPIPNPPEEFKQTEMCIEDIKITKDGQIDEIIDSIKRITGQVEVSYLLSYTK